MLRGSGHHNINTLKQAFTKAPILSHWVPNRQLIVETDASDHALAAILSIVLDDDIHPIAFLFRLFTDTEINYNTHNKELLAIFQAFTKWCHYLEGAPLPIDIVTDHKNLKYFTTTKVLTQYGRSIFQRSIWQSDSGPVGSVGNLIC